MGLGSGSGDSDVLRGAEDRPVQTLAAERKALRAEQEEKQRRETLFAQRRAAIRLLKAKQAKESLIAFTRYTMPDIKEPLDAEKSRYDDQYFHRALAAALEGAESGEIPRLIITFPPRHGKSELTSRRYPAYLLGRDPYRHIILATYNQPFAEDFGRKVRDIMQSPSYAEIFPEATLAKGSQAADRLATEEGGMAAFVGRKGSTTGRGADFLIIDDPLKDSNEAQSPTIRDECWSWFNNTASTRLMTDTGVIIIIMTRWHEDDIVGRLTDPANAHYNAAEAAEWKIINIPALAEENDVLGRKPGEALWPSKFGVKYLQSMKRRLGKAFSSLYQQHPTPEDGDFFQADMMRTYRREDLPKNLRIYAASDHAVGIKQEHDKNCFLIIGVDTRDHIWILDCWWRRAKTNVSVEAMLSLMKLWKPTTWWAESGHITKSIGPFLFARMIADKVYVHVKEQSTNHGDKLQRAQSIQGRMSMGMVHWPAFESWYEDAKSELMKFPGGKHDDFVDALAHVGMGLDKILRAPAPTVAAELGPRIGSLAWVKHDATFRGRVAARQKLLRGM